MKKEKADRQANPKILVVRFRRVGDAVLSASVISSLKKSIPGCRIDYVLDAGIAPIFEHHPDIDNIIAFTHDEKHSMPTYLKKVRRLMHQNRYDIVIDLRSTINTLPFAIFAKGAKYKIGTKKPYTRLFYNKLIELDSKGDIADMLLQRIEPLAAEYDIVKDKQFSLYCTAQEVDDFKRYMSGKGIDFGKPVMICAVVTRLEHKMWPLDRMRDTIARILDAYPDLQLVFNYGGGREKELAAELWEQLGRPERVFMDIEAKGLRQLLAMISLSDFFFGNEGGPRHIAQALGIPSYAIFPPHIPKSTWLPGAGEFFAGIEPKDLDPHIEDDRNHGYAQIFDIVTPDAVWEGLEPMLSRYTAIKTNTETQTTNQ